MLPTASFIADGRPTAPAPALVPSRRGGARPGAGRPPGLCASTREHLVWLHELACNPDPAIIATLPRADLEQICCWKYLARGDWWRAGRLAARIARRHHHRGRAAPAFDLYAVFAADHPIWHEQGRRPCDPAGVSTPDPVAPAAFAPAVAPRDVFAERPALGVDHAERPGAGATGSVAAPSTARPVSDDTVKPTFELYDVSAAGQGRRRSDPERRRLGAIEPTVGVVPNPVSPAILVRNPTLDPPARADAVAPAHLPPTQPVPRQPSPRRTRHPGSRRASASRRQPRRDPLERPRHPDRPPPAAPPAIRSARNPRAGPRPPAARAMKTEFSRPRHRTRVDRPHATRGRTPRPLPLRRRLRAEPA